MPRHCPHLPARRYTAYLLHTVAASNTTHSDQLISSHPLTLLSIPKNRYKHNQHPQHLFPRSTTTMSYRNSGFCVGVDFGTT